ncbi:MAG: TlpA family protein disulfide reductase [Candidatus Tyrphobacter sp.]
MRDRRTLVIAAISAIVIVAIVVWAVTRAQHPTASQREASYAPVVSQLEVGSRAPEFSIPSTAGMFDLDAQRRPVLVEIFASWCPHCQRETAVLNQLYGTFKSRIAFIAIPGNNTGMDGGPESTADLINFIGRFHVVYPVAIYDPQLTIADEYIHGGYPTIVVVGTNKKILYVDSGEVSYAALAGILTQALT